MVISYLLDGVSKGGGREREGGSGEEGGKERGS